MQPEDLEHRAACGVPGSQVTDEALLGPILSPHLGMAGQLITRVLVDNPEQVTVTALQGSQATVLELKVAKEDLGKIIGKQGRTAKSIRTILGAASAKENKRTVLEIVE